MKGGEYMLKKAAIATGVFAISTLTAASMAFAQTATPTTTTSSTVTPTPSSAAMPSAAPATGHAK